MHDLNRLYSNNWINVISLKKIIIDYLRFIVRKQQSLYSFQFKYKLCNRGKTICILIGISHKVRYVSLNDAEDNSNYSLISNGFEPNLFYAHINTLNFETKYKKNCTCEVFFSELYLSVLHMWSTLLRTLWFGQKQYFIKGSFTFIHQKCCSIGLFNVESSINFYGWYENDSNCFMNTIAARTKSYALFSYKVTKPF